MRIAAAGVVPLLGAVICAAPRAEAQPVKPNILIIFDTSGSMQANSGGALVGEGTNICPSGTSSRLYLLKKAMREALAQVGTDEVNFGLMSFPSLVDPARTPSCYSCCSLASAGNTYSGHFYIQNPAGDSGCAITNHTAAGSPTTYGAWFDSGITQALRVDVTGATAGTMPAAADFDPPDANLARVYKWIDNSEDTGPVVGTLTDPELHAIGATPLGRSLFYARLYFENYVRPVDPKRACRQSLVILVTDGDETCDFYGGAVDPTTCAGGTGSFDHNVEACRLYRQDGIKVHVLTDSSTGPDNDQIAEYGGTTEAIRVTLTDSSEVREQLVAVIAGAVPPPELCNGRDDNCNNVVDEGVANACAWSIVGGRPNDCVDPPACTKYRHCAAEACNCVDDDCDGETDEGLPINACGAACGCALPQELCNGLDDDCDGDIDEGFMVGASCHNGGVGACRKYGIRFCNPAGDGTVCEAPAATGSAELCNGADDDCDGATDEDHPMPGEDEMCGYDVGACKRGVTVCKDGRIDCQNADIPIPEDCNGIDDDCNGSTDDGTFVGQDEPCLCPGLDPSKADVGECRRGRLHCRGSRGMVCEGCGLPGNGELCDGKDNDCDGVTDFQAPCPEGFGCAGGQCAPECKLGEFPCAAGFVCRNGYCLSTKCGGVVCPKGQYCKEGECYDPCAGVTCPSPMLCFAGKCVDCHVAGCPSAGDICVAGACTPDRCADVTCAHGQYCDAGSCIKLCAAVRCGKDESCAAGLCRPDPCLRVACRQHEVCDPTSGECRPDDCETKQCAPGQRCVPASGECVPDPCATVRCLGGCDTCRMETDGVAHCVVDPVCKAKQTQVGTRGGGWGSTSGCGCTQAPAGPPGGVALLAAAMAWAAAARGTRRRRPPRR